MATKNAENAHFWQVDHRVKHLAKLDQALVLPSPEAWERFLWSRKYFATKPLEGYFVWIREKPLCPLFTCVNILGKNITQKLANLVVIEEGLQIVLHGFCGSLNPHTQGGHQTAGKIILKKGVNLKYTHVHAWKGQDSVEPDYEFSLEEGVKLDYTYEVKVAPKILRMQNTFICQQGSSVRFNVLADCQDTDFTIRDRLILRGEDSHGLSNLRFVARKNSTIRAISQLVATARATGHVDCQSLMLAKNSRVSLLPEIVSGHKDAELTHEAAIGKVSDEQINYLRTRGLSLDQALDLIVTGFLKLSS